ncbi:hypothetical protein GVX82_02945 [Patescibacteria group bacterium]|jgi:predicted ribosomally synthesized peptide with SipW-like signal peptide|nr:hypothetical protein [Patescibacteria group bacterium]
MKRIFLSLAMIVFVGALVAGGTGAFFSDTETSTGNVFAAGALDLKVDSVAHYNGMICFDSGPDFSDGYKWLPADTVEWVEPTDDEDGFYQLVPGTELGQAIETFNSNNPALNPRAGDECEGTWELTDLGPENTFFDFGDLKPGDDGENTISIHVFNNESYMCAAIHDVESDDNDCTEPETDAETDEYGEGAETCGDPGTGEGELDRELNFLVWEDDGDNILQEDELGAGEEGILFEGGADDGLAGVYPLYTPSLNGALATDTIHYLGVYWCYGDIDRDGASVSCDGEPVSNLTQTDSLTANVSFYVEQARNNDGFDCPALEEFEDDGSAEQFTLFHDADEDNEEEGGEVNPVRVASLGSHDGSQYEIGDLFTVEEVYGSDEEYTLDITNGGGNYEFVVNTPFVVSGTDNSMSILFDADNDGTADFQYEYTGDAFIFKEQSGSGFSAVSEPAGYSASESGGQQVFTFIIPKTELDDIFKVAVNATDNGSPQAGTHLGMGIPEWDVFDGGNWTSSVNYLLVDTN